MFACGQHNLLTSPEATFQRICFCVLESGDDTRQTDPCESKLSSGEPRHAWPPTHPPGGAAGMPRAVA